MSTTRKAALDRASATELPNLFALLALGAALDALCTRAATSATLTAGSDAITLPDEALRIDCVEALSGTSSGVKARTLKSTPGAGEYKLGTDGVTITFAAADGVLTAAVAYVPVPAVKAALAAEYPDVR